MTTNAGTNFRSVEPQRKCSHAHEGEDKRESSQQADGTRQAGVRLGNRKHRLTRLEPDVRGRQPAQQVDPCGRRQRQCDHHQPQPHGQVHPRSRTRISRCFAFYVYAIAESGGIDFAVPLPTRQEPIHFVRGASRQASGRRCRGCFTLTCFNQNAAREPACFTADAYLYPHNHARLQWIKGDPPCHYAIISVRRSTIPVHGTNYTAHGRPSW